MAKIDFKFDQLDSLFPSNFTDEQIAKGKTEFLKHLAFYMHKFYGG